MACKKEECHSILFKVSKLHFHFWIYCCFCFMFCPQLSASRNRDFSVFAHVQLFQMFFSLAI